MCVLEPSGRLCVSENAESVGSLQARVKAGGLKNKGLLKDLDDTLRKLNAIPNGNHRNNSRK